MGSSTIGQQLVLGVRASLGPSDPWCLSIIGINWCWLLQSLPLFPWHKFMFSWLFDKMWRFLAHHNDYRLVNFEIYLQVVKVLGCNLMINLVRFCYCDCILQLECTKPYLISLNPQDWPETMQWAWKWWMFCSLRRTKAVKVQWSPYTRI